MSDNIQAHAPLCRYISAFRQLIADDSASELAEYSIVLATLTISMIVAFQLVTSSANSNVSGNQQHITNSSTAAGGGAASP